MLHAVGVSISTRYRHDAVSVTLTMRVDEPHTYLVSVCQLSLIVALLWLGWSRSSSQVKSSRGMTRLDLTGVRRNPSRFWVTPYTVNKLSTNRYGDLARAILFVSAVELSFFQLFEYRQIEWHMINSNLTNSFILTDQHIYQCYCRHWLTSWNIYVQF